MKKFKSALLFLVLLLFAGLAVFSISHRDGGGDGQNGEEAMPAARGSEAEGAASTGLTVAEGTASAGLAAPEGMGPAGLAAPEGMGPAGLITPEEADWDDYEEREWGDYVLRVSKDRVAIFKYKGTDTELEIPAMIDGMPVTRIWSIAFRDWSGAYMDDGVASGLEEVVIPEGVTRIGSLAFANQWALKTVRIPASANRIGGGFLNGCLSLETVEIAEDNPVYCVTGDGIFGKDGKLLHTYLPLGDGGSRDGAGAVGDEGGRTDFAQGERASYAVPDTVTLIGKYAFWDRDELREVRLPEGLAAIDDNAFWWCGSLKELELPESLISIGEGAFDGCESLKKMTIPQKVAKIGPGAFGDCFRLKELKVQKGNKAFMARDGVLFSRDGTLLHTYLCANRRKTYRAPSEVKEIAQWAFRGCETLKEITLPDGLAAIGDEAFAYCRMLRRIEIPAGVEAVPDGLCAGCWNLKEAVLSDGVISIGQGAFEDCETLERVDIPDSVVTIEEDAFVGCPEGLVLTVGEGSAAQEYAKAHGMETEVR